jgi:hypothetical protein
MEGNMSKTLRVSAGPARHKIDATNGELIGELIRIGLKDPFIRGIVGVVVIAAAASFAISALGSGTKAIITLALSLSFGVILLILRTLMKNIDSGFVRTVCFLSSAVIMAVFLIFAVFLAPAAFICWPPSYAIILGLKSCGTIEKPFKPVAFPATAIAFNADNAKYNALVLYRAERQEDAENVVGALRSAGFQSKGIVDDLNELTEPYPGATVIRWTTTAQPVVTDVSKTLRIAIPVKASTISVSPNASSFTRGEIQINLF